VRHRFAYNARAIAARHWARMGSVVSEMSILCAPGPQAAACINDHDETEQQSAQPTAGDGMYYYLDTEFIEDGRTIDLVSIGIVAADGRELYLESAEAALERAGDFVKEQVIPKLGPVEQRVSRAAIRAALLKFVGDDKDPWFVAYYADYDWVALCQLFGTMVDLPSGWPMFCLDLRQLMYHKSIDPSKLRPRDGRGLHNALDDARWVKWMWEKSHGHVWHERWATR